VRADPAAERGCGGLGICGHAVDTYPGRIPGVSVSDTYPTRDTPLPRRIRVSELLMHNTTHHKNVYTLVNSPRVAAGIFGPYQKIAGTIVV